jgi:thymidylate synthase ThyX
MKADIDPILRYVSNLDKNVFVLKNLPEVVKGALFSRYSRSAKSLRDILRDEFMPEFADDDESDIELVRSQKAEAFYDRVLTGYGDDSIAELGSVHIALENISNIAAKAIEDCRIGISPLEKSSRYVDFGAKVDDVYQYYRSPNLQFYSSNAEMSYIKSMNFLFETYNAMYPKMLDYIKQANPKSEGTNDKAYDNAIKAKALDSLRGLLPMSTLTNVGIHGNGRALEYLIIKLRSPLIDELRNLSYQIQEELDKSIPSFVKRSKDEKGYAFSGYISNRHADISWLTKSALSKGCFESADLVSNDPETILTKFELDGVDRVIAAIMYPHASDYHADLMAVARSMSDDEKDEIITAYVGDRSSRHIKVGRAFEEIHYNFEILADIGAYRDLQRHRMMSQDRQAFTVDYSYSVPIDIIRAGLEAEYRSAMDQAYQTYQDVYDAMPDFAQYVVPFGYKIHWRIKMNLRQAFHLIELRSTLQAHPNYRSIALSMHKLISTVHPLLGKHMIIDQGNADLERLAAEEKLSRKQAPGA